MTKIINFGSPNSNLPLLGGRIIHLHLSGMFSFLCINHPDLFLCARSSSWCVRDMCKEHSLLCKMYWDLGKKGDMDKGMWIEGRDKEKVIDVLWLATCCPGTMRWHMGVHYLKQKHIHTHLSNPITLSQCHRAFWSNSSIFIPLPRPENSDGVWVCI